MSRSSSDATKVGFASATRDVVLHRLGHAEPRRQRVQNLPADWSRSTLLNPQLDTRHEMTHPRSSVFEACRSVST